LSLSACGRTVTVSMDDQAITARVRTALLNEPNLSARDITVQTSRRVVTLSGTVPTGEERDLAIAVARRSAGVADVHSELRIAS
jgi:hyperosmotically inducible protein